MEKQVTSVRGGTRVKQQKIGVWTSAVALIAFGIIILLNVIGVASYSVLKYLWPVLVILFGIEIIWTYARHKDEKVQYSGWSIALLVLVMVLSLGTFAIQSLIHRIRWSPGYAEPIHGQVNISNRIRKVQIELPNTPVTVVGTAKHVLSYDGIVKIDASSQRAADEAVRRQWTVRQVGDTLEMKLADEGPGWNSSFTGMRRKTPRFSAGDIRRSPSGEIFCVGEQQ